MTRTVAPKTRPATPSSHGSEGNAPPAQLWAAVDAAMISQVASTDRGVALAAGRTLNLLAPE
jgi:hypothetical protein